MTNELQQWEYLVEINRNSFSPKIKVAGFEYGDINEYLAVRGADGWELCGCDSRNLQFIFKRPKTHPQ